MDKPLFNDPAVYPSDELLRAALGAVHPPFERFRDALAEERYAVSFEWRYYRDGGAWLCKAAHGKKTVFWLSAWEGYFKVSFFFLERHLDALAALGLDERNFTMKNEWGKMIPLICDIRDEKPLDDLLKTVLFKKKAK